jgi:hypothetical protein
VSRLDAAVMRPYSIAAVVAIGSLIACSSTDPRNAPSAETREEFVHCKPANGGTWQSVAPPPEAKAILNLPMERGTLDHELWPGKANDAIHEHWFNDGDSRIAICRHLPVRDNCHSQASLVYLTKVDGKWAAPKEVIDSICVLHSRDK